MSQLQNYGVITQEEYEQAEREGKFLITDDVVCSYCQAPIRVQNQEKLYCQQHQQLALSMHWWPDYPGVPKEVPRYKQMHFHLSRIDPLRSLFSEERVTDLAANKGCPFCDRYMSAVDPLIEERQISLLNKRLFCPECGVCFRIVVEADEKTQTALALRFQPEASSLEVKLPPEDTPPPEDVIEADTQIDPFTLSDDDFTIWFLEENLVADPEHFLPNQEVYRRYQQVCSTYYRQPLEDRRLYQSLRKLYSVSSTRRRIDSIPTRGFLGVRSVDPNDQ